MRGEAGEGVGLVGGEAGDRVGLVRLGVVRRREECES